MLEINGKKIVNLMEIIGINSERKEKFDEEELKKAKENLMKIGAKLPEGFEEKVKQSLRLIWCTVIHSIIILQKEKMHSKGWKII